MKHEYLRRAYKLQSWTDGEDFLGQVARGAGKLCKGGDPDLNTAAKMVLHDWQRGKIPFFTMPPDDEAEPDRPDDEAEEEAEEEEEDPTGHQDEIEKREAELIASGAATALGKQQKAHLPVQDDFFDHEDNKTDTEDEGGATSDEDKQGNEQDDDDEESDDDGDDESNDDDGDDDDDESDDGYGEDGLSWEAVMAAMKGA